MRASRLQSPGTRSAIEAAKALEHIHLDSVLIIVAPERSAATYDLQLAVTPYDREVASHPTQGTNTA